MLVFPKIGILTNIPMIIKSAAPIPVATTVRIELFFIISL